nr:hypothetical protein [uncultured Halomonas sp.]
MKTIDSWQMVFDKAGDLADSLLHEQPKDMVDALDIEEQIISAIQELASGEVNPKEDWSVIIKPVSKGSKIDERIANHFDIALRQAVFVRVLFEYHMQKIKEYYSESSQLGMLIKVGEDMLAAYACAQQHATAWRLLSGVRDKSYETRSQNANQIKAEKKEERELLLRCLIESSLERLRPGGGWRSHIIAAQIIAEDLGTMAASYALPITSDEDELSEKVQLMIWKEPRLRKAYNETAKKPIEEPVKTRKIVLSLSPGDGE